MLFTTLTIYAITSVPSVPVPNTQGRVVQKAISANLGLKFNRLYILVCCA